MTERTRRNGASAALVSGRGRVKAASLSNQAYQQIREMILKGEFGVGEPLSRRKLAHSLHMSFLPISEALQRLEAEELVESQPRIGTRVRVPSAEDIRDRYVVREALESQAARLFAERATGAEKEELTRMGKHLDRLHEVCASESVDSEFMYSVHRYHMDFHLRIAEFARCGALRAAIEREQVLIFNWLFDTVTQRTLLPPRFHSELCKALVGNDAEKADGAMRQHVRWGLERAVAGIGSVVRPNGWRTKRLPNG